MKYQLLYFGIILHYLYTPAWYSSDATEYKQKKEGRIRKEKRHSYLSCYIEHIVLEKRTWE